MTNRCSDDNLLGGIFPRNIIRFLLLFLAAVMVTVSVFLPVPSGADDDLTDTFDLWYSRYVGDEIDELTPGGSVEIQINVKYDVKSICLSLTNPDGTEETRARFSVKVYRWDTNILKSLEGEVVTEGTAEGPVSEGDAVFDFGGSALSPGEYVVKWEMISGGRAHIERRRPAPFGVRYYYSEKCGYGSPVGTIVFTENVSSPFALTSENVDLKYHEAPPEPTLSPDSAIAVLDVDSTKWGGVDGLGRALPSYGSAGGKKQKLVGIFYWTWHWSFGSRDDYPPLNINNVLRDHPEATNDYYNEIWQTPASGNFWNEPLWGYYTEEDDYVLRKHAELLADAGVDFVMFDCTNADAVWTEAYLNLLKVWSQAREDGVNTPKIGFMMQFGYSGNTRSSLWQVYTTIYRDNKYQDLWFYWDGKPLVMAWDTGLDEKQADELTLKQFFTFRYPCPSYWEGEHDDTCWGWLSTWPQALYKNEDGSVEMTTVGIAQNANYETQSLSAMNSGSNMGRSYAGNSNYSYSYNYRGRRITVDANIENSKLYGRNFQEQWDYAISVDPEIVFVTGWNEWIMGRYDNFCGVPNGFPDQCDDENSRDIEPSKGDLKDYYYYQLVANIRRFKGMSEPDYQPESKTIDIAGDLSQWNDGNIVTYNHYAHNTLERDYKGYGKTYYTGDAARNDFVKAKVSYDKDNIWFYVETLDAITPYTDPCWMRLLIDAGEATSKSTDWEEFEFIAGREGTTADTMRLERSTGGWNWEKVADVKYSVSGNVLVLEIPRSLLGDAGKKLKFGFKWCDNNLQDGDVLTLYTDGDAAPGGRFTFLFAAKPDSTFPWYIIAIVCGALAAAAAVIAVLRMKKKKAG